MSDHHDHPLPPPEEDVINAASLTFWGVASFVFVLVSIFGVSSYFWLELVNEDNNKVYNSSPYAKLRTAQNTDVQDKLTNVKDLWQVSKKGRAVAVYNSKALSEQAVKAGKGDAAKKLDKVQIPIEQAMKLIVKERAKSFKKPAPKPAPAPVVADPNAVAPAPAPKPAP